MYGGLLSRYLSTLVTGGDTCEVMEKSDRQELSSDDFFEEISDFELPPLAHFEIYARKFRVYKSDNLPFHKFAPTPEELHVNEHLNEQTKKRKLNIKRQQQENNYKTKPSKSRQIVPADHLMIRVCQIDQMYLLKVKG